MLTPQQAHIEIIFHEYSDDSDDLRFTVTLY